MLYQIRLYGCKLKLIAYMYAPVAAPCNLDGSAREPLEVAASANARHVSSFNFGRSANLRLALALETRLPSIALSSMTAPLS